ncbi:MAG TPA: DmsC/YnfH family molybdoenzyme membrane anchor subunit [Acetobacteraceae bacterium]|nr:DmsC/YnfH family molybdoenzyme membrane anchor subunit [Acetobacteraceae bacterium]
MNPAFSVILLTTASGAGYGMLAWLGVLNALRLLPSSPWFGVPAIFVALALSTIGLLASTLHLGHPERAWRSISQWRTSWLSREGVMALLTYLPALGFAAAWWFTGAGSGAAAVLGLLAAACSLATICCQAMIYATLKPIRQWSNRLVPPNFLLLALFTGAACLAGALALDDAAAARLVAAIAVVSAVAAGAVKLAYWRQIDAAPPVATIESATGLGALGRVRMLESPHTEENFLLREMGYAIARKHATRLRAIALAVGFIAPVVLLVLGIVLPPANRFLLPLAALAAVLGIYVERWLFFAEATHTVTLYYGRRDERPA